MEKLPPDSVANNIGSVVAAKQYGPYPAYRDSGVEWLEEIPVHWELKRLRFTVFKCQNGLWGDEPDGEGDVEGIDPDTPMKYSGVVWLGEIPSHWKIRQLNRVIEKFVDYRDKTPEKVAFGVPLVTAGNIKNQMIDFSDSQEFISEELYPKWMVRGLPEPGDVIVTTEAPLGECAQVNGMKIALAQRIILLKAMQDKIGNDYLKYHFVSDFGQHELQTRSTGSTALGVKASHLKVSLIVVPPIEEQVKIATLLDRESAKIDALISKIREAIDRLKELRIALISAAVTGKIDVREAVS